MDAFRIQQVLQRRGALSLVFAIAIGPVVASGNSENTHTKSPDKHLVAVVSLVRNPTSHAATESTVSILTADGALLGKQDFSSQFGDQGYVVDGVKWTPDSQYCAFRMRSSGGHSPMFAPIVIWNRRTNHFYSLVNYTADIAFSVAAPDKVKASTWPRMKPATVSLHLLNDSDLSELR
jgi:hypothetical protein